MSSSPTAPTSTTGSSTSSPSPADTPPRVALIACGAIAQPCASLVARTGWPVDVHPLPPLLHNQPHRLAGLHCYDLYAGPSEVSRLFEEEPGTYLLTDFLVRSFDRTVLAELGLDRYPELHDAYFGHYRRVVWLRQDASAGLEVQAQEAADRLGLPLTVIDTGHHGLVAAL